MRKRLLYFAILVSLILLCACNGQSTIRESDLPPPSDAALENQQLRAQLANVQAEMDTLRSELRSVNGQLEEVNHSLEQTNRRTLDNATAAAMADTTGSIAAPTVAAAAAGAATTTVAVVSNDTPDLPEQAFYDRAKENFDVANYEEARVQFENFVKFYPKSGIANNAVFWIGETYYRQNNFERAILEYQRVLDNYPNGSKVPAAIYKQGLSFINMGDNKNGKILLEDLVRRYPDSQEARVAQNRLKNL